MGARTFDQKERGDTVESAYAQAVERAQWDHGHSGYTGTIAEKAGYVEFPVPAGRTADEIHEALCKTWTSEGIQPLADIVGGPMATRMYAVYYDKWGAAVALRSADDEWLFCGWASC